MWDEQCFTSVIISKLWKLPSGSECRWSAQTKPADQNLPFIGALVSLLTQKLTGA